MRLHALLAVLLPSALAAAHAGELYQWKDARGVTHYSQNPPPAGAYKVRKVGSRPGNIAPPAAATAAPAESAQCSTARKNLELLAGTQSVQVDSDGDGKPDRTLSDADRANQRELIQATLKANCSVAAGK